MTASSMYPPLGGQRVLVVQAHPDDAEHLCGGTIALLAEEGRAIHYLLVTRGDKGTDDPEINPAHLATLREQEQRQAANTLGVETVTFLDGYADSEVEPTLTLRRQLAYIIRQWQPESILTFDPWRRYEVHPDHRAVGISTLDAVACARNPLSFPEQLTDGVGPHRVRDIYYFSTDQPNYWVDISTVVEKKIEALRCHESQTKHKDLYAWVSEKGKIAGLEHKLKFAEAFHHQVI